MGISQKGGKPLVNASDAARQGGHVFRTTEEGETARYGVGRVPSKTRHGPSTHRRHLPHWEHSLSQTLSTWSPVCCRESLFFAEVGKGSKFGRDTVKGGAGVSEINHLLCYTCSTELPMCAC